MPVTPEEAARDAQLRVMLAQLLASKVPPGGPLPPSGGFAGGAPPAPPMPNAGASNMSIQPGLGQYDKGAR